MVDFARNAAVSATNKTNKTITTFFNVKEKYDVKILDVGCGSGYLLKEIRKFCNSIIGLDLQDIFDYRLLKDDKISFVRANATKLPFKDEEFDMIYSMDVIEHIKDDLAFLVESKRCLKKNGLIIIGTPNYSRLSMFMSNVFNLRRWPHYIGSNSVLGNIIHIREYTKQQLIILIGKARFNVCTYKPLWLGLFKPYVGIKYPKIMKKCCQYHYVVGKK